MAAALRVGILSDTHGYLDPRIPRLFSGLDHILHAGDIGLPSIILELESVAPVTAVLGNTDGPIGYRETEQLELGGRKFLVHHIVDVRSPSEAFKTLVLKTNPDMVAFGHTHQSFSRQIGNILFLNPGYCGRPRTNQPRSVAILTIENGRFFPAFHEL